MSVQWFGELPERWELHRLKFFYKEVDYRSQTGNEEMLSVSHITGITPRSQKNVTMFMSESNVGLKICQPDDIVVNTMWAWMAALGVSAFHGIISPSYGVYRPINNMYNPKYLNYLLRTEEYRTEYVRRSTGIRSSRLRLYPDQFLDTRVILPPRDEQDQIVRYLDWKVSEINWLIAKKHMQHINLTLYRIKMNNDLMNKVNGEYARFKNVFSLRKGLSITKEDLRNEGVPCVNYGEIHSKFGFEINADDVKELKCVDEKFLLNYPNALLKYGDFVIADTSEDIKCSGAFTYLNNHTKTFAGYHTIIASAKIPINHRFVAYYFDSEPYRLQIWRSVNGVKVYSITQSILNNTLIKFPSEEEQNEIVSILDKKGEKIERISNTFLKEAELLKEYRTRFISDVVTGKLNVRGMVVPEYEAVEDVAVDEEAEEEIEMEDE